MIILKQSTITDVVLGPFIDDADGKTTEEALTLAQADLQLTKNGATAAQKNDTSSATHLYGGNYKVDLNATDTNTVGHLRLMCKEAGALPVIADFMVVEEAIYDALYGASAAGFDANGRVDVGSVLGTAQTANDNGADINTLLTRVVGTLAAGTHNAQSGDAYARLGAPAGASVSADIAANQTDLGAIETDTQDIQARLPAALVGGRIDASAGAIAANVITATAIATDAITSAKIATDAIGSDELATTAVAEIADGVWDEDIADHVATGTFGEALYLNAYAGPNGPGVVIDDGAANTATVAGEDGTWGKPVSTMAAARTIADAIGVNQYYLCFSIFNRSTPCGEMVINQWA